MTNLGEELWKYKFEFVFTGPEFIGTNIKRKWHKLADCMPLCVQSWNGIQFPT